MYLPHLSVQRILQSPQLFELLSSRETPLDCSDVLYFLPDGSEGELGGLYELNALAVLTDLIPLSEFGAVSFSYLLPDGSEEDIVSGKSCELWYYQNSRILSGAL